MLIAPLLLIARYSGNRYDATELMIEAATPANYLRFFSDPFYLSVMRTTIGVAVAVTLLCLAFGMPIALRIARMPPRWKSIATLLTIMPLFIGSVVRTVGWLILFARGGMLDILSRRFSGHGVDLMYATPAVIVAHRLGQPALHDPDAAKRLRRHRHAASRKPPAASAPRLPAPFSASPGRSRCRAR